MSVEMQLCIWCAKIPLDPFVLDKNRANGKDRFDLGSLERLVDSPCPICQLVTKAISESRLDLSDCHGIELHWGPGPIRRRSFHVRSRDATTKRRVADMYIGFGRTATNQPKDLKTNSRYFVRPVSGPVLDTTRVLHWISSCEELHGPLCGDVIRPSFTETFRDLSLLRLIDIEDDCLVEKQSLRKYVALSYVWGAASNFRLTTANRTAMLAPGSLKKISHLLPKTIKDTISLVRRLGARYLWVDALCLMQNDAEDLQNGVDNMDLIYELAWVTVVAGYGQDANAGLPGVQVGSRSASMNTVKIQPQVELGVVAGLDGLLKSSVYNARAWTFQELVLSRRVLYFLGNRVFYRCRAAEHGEHFEDIMTQNNSDITTSGSLLPMAVKMDSPYSDYDVMLMYYTQRALSNEKDAVRAMTGIIRRFSKAMKCRFMEGLPTSIFDIYLLFHGSNDSILHRRSSFPSYSWSGWRGHIYINANPLYSSGIGINRWLMERTWIIWYKRSRNGVTNLVWDPAANESFPYEDQTIVGYRQRYPFRDEWWNFEEELNTQRTMPTASVQFSRDLPTYPILQFWTLSAFYNITDIDAFHATGYLADINGNKCGFVSLDGFEETTFFGNDDPFEVILLSESSSESFKVYKIHFPHLNFDFVSRFASGNGQWQFFNFLLLEWQDGIAERRGFGCLTKNAVENCLAPGPRWKEIFLA